MFGHILVPLDGSSLAECVLPHVRALAIRPENRVTLLRVLDETQITGHTSFVDPLGWYMEATEVKAYLDNLSVQLKEDGLQTEVALLEGRAAERIVDFVRDNDIDLVVLSSHGRSGLSEWNVSSIVFKIILRARVPVMIVRAYQPVADSLGELRYHRVLVPLDCSQRAECALPIAGVIANIHQAELLAAHVVTKPVVISQRPPDPEEIELSQRIIDHNREQASKYLEQLRRRMDGEVRTRLLVNDNAAAALHDLVEEAEVDLVVLSAHGHTGSSKWPYGSLVVNFISYGTTPLLIVQDLLPDEVEFTKAEVYARERKGH